MVEVLILLTTVPCVIHKSAQVNTHRPDCQFVEATEALFVCFCALYDVLGLEMLGEVLAMSATQCVYI